MYNDNDLNNLFEEYDPVKDGATEVSPYELSLKPFESIGRDWMLITSADKSGKINAMTASWGGVGVLWNKPVAFCFIRPQRYTFELLELQPDAKFSLCFVGNRYRNALNVCGRESGRNQDKITLAGLSAGGAGGVPVIKESEMIITCKRLYTDFIKEENFIERDLIDKNYPARDFHKMYICEIEKIYVKNQ